MSAYRNELVQRNFYFGIAAGNSGIHDGGHTVKIVFQNARAVPLGMLWSKRMRIGHTALRRNRRRIKAAGGEFKHRFNLFGAYVKLLNDFLNVGARFKVLEDRRNRHPRILQNPCAA